MNEVEFVGRKVELKELDRLVNLKKLGAKLIGIDGRRRVGKTSLVTEFVERNDYIYINFIGNLNSSSLENLLTSKSQLEKIVLELNQTYDLTFKVKMLSRNWFSFFSELDRLIKELAFTGKKIVIFFDEICWFSKKTNFINEFANAWNGYLMHHNHLVIIMAGSSSSWMKEQIFGSTTVLYNRLTGVIHLKPFSLRDIGRWIKNINHSVSYMDIVQYYCVFGGIISYYHYFDFNLSFKTNFENLFKLHLNKLKLEHDILFKSLFEHKRQHEVILDKLVQSKAMSCQEFGLSNTSDVYKDLKELEDNDLLSIYKNERGVQIYQLYDLFTLFFNYWIGREKYKEFAFENGSYNYWKGYAFEILVLSQFNDLFEFDSAKDEIKLNHQIKKVKAHQIDMMLFTQSTNYIIEVKNYNNVWQLYSKDAEQMKERIFDLENEYEGKRTLLILITACGAKISEKLDLNAISINVSEKLKEMLN